MIPQSAITEWSHKIPWVGLDQIEHDLILSRAICCLYNHPVVQKQLVFRGGTVLHKLFFKKPGRFSEDLDFVQINAGPIGEVITAVRESLDPWLGLPKWKQGQGRFTLFYRFETENMPVSRRKVKVEINTREHFKLQPLVSIPYAVDSRWFSGKSDVMTYCLEELMATKLRALYQRKKGRDLYDFWYVNQHYPEIDTGNIVSMFERYMDNGNCSVSRAEFEENIARKESNEPFNNDIYPILSVEQSEQYSPSEAYIILKQKYMPKLKGETWKGIE
ncbi:MAG: nucleotidyl transferase AbiEii/AbiGii toxin family protein [Coxiellaceae bacterium]|nr:nucleotidyl transferase AbiEii/AbiGii toxin family protein [Coxiellaceae bacterium]